MAVASTGVVTLDCAEPRPLAEFWAAMLGAEGGRTRGGATHGTWRRIARGQAVRGTAVGVRTDWVWLAAMKVADYHPPTWPEADVPKQIHLDLSVSDLTAAVDEAERLGATPAAFQPAPDLRRILLDPAGHPFCLTTQVPRGALEG